MSWQPGNGETGEELGPRMHPSLSCPSAHLADQAPPPSSMLGCELRWINSPVRQHSIPVVRSPSKDPASETHETFGGHLDLNHNLGLSNQVTAGTIFWDWHTERQWWQHLEAR